MYCLNIINLKSKMNSFMVVCNGEDEDKIIANEHFKV